MIIKQLDEQSFNQIKEIHNKYFSDQFDLNDLFNNKILDQIVVCDDNNKVITYGGIKLLFEVVAVTDLNRSARDRKQALIKMLDVIISIAEKKKFEQIHCFPTFNEKWTEHLKDIGFKQTKGTALYLNV